MAYVAIGSARLARLSQKAISEAYLDCLAAYDVYIEYGTGWDSEEALNRCSTQLKVLVAKTFRWRF